MADWQLFVDESGKFDRDDERVVVAGVLLPGADHPSRQQELRDWLKATFPASPYPPHQRVLNLAAGVAAFVARDHALAPELAPARDALAACPLHADVRELRTAPPESLREETLRRVDDWLRNHARPTYDRLRQHISERQRVAARGFAKVLGDEGAVVVAAEARPRAPTHDRYLDLLEVLLERVALLLRGDEGHRVLTLVAERNVKVPGRAPPGRLAPIEVTRLRRDHVEKAAKGASARLLANGVSFAVAQPSAYDVRCHPGLALADLAANRARRALIQESFEDLSAMLLKELGARPVGRALRFQSPLPSLTGSGDASGAVADVARDPTRKPATSAVQPRWAREQAEVWVGMLGGARA